MPPSPPSDPHRPIFHVMPRGQWLNDPNGPVHFQGQYHLFYQYNPTAPVHGSIHWGHAASPDLVHWRHLPIALAPTPGSPDQDGVWSGCALIDQGVPTVIYTAVHPESQCLATSQDGLLTWRKDPKPIIPRPPAGLEWTGFRDPFAWREDGAWHLAVGAGIRNVGGTILHYRSQDLKTWEDLGLLCVGDASLGPMWECPMFVDLGRRHLLVVSPYGPPIAMMGSYRDGTFHREDASRLDGGDSFYAPTSMLAPDGTPLMWGWLREARSEASQRAAGWSGALSLPRELALGDDGSLVQQPARALVGLRGQETREASLELPARSTRILSRISGAHLEIRARIRCQGDGWMLRVRRSPDGEQGIDIGLIRDPQGGWLLGVDTTASSTSPDTERRRQTMAIGPMSDGVVDIIVYLDGSICEVFANRDRCISVRVYPDRPDCLGVSLTSASAPVALESLASWTMDSIWPPGDGPEPWA